MIFNGAIVEITSFQLSKPIKQAMVDDSLPSKKNPWKSLIKQIKEF